MKKNKKIDLKFLNKNVNVFSIIGVYTAFALLFMLITVIFGSGTAYSVEDLFDSNSYKLNDEIIELVGKQNRSINKLIAASNNGEYTINDPYILVNPFYTNSLSAMVVFYTNTSTSVSIEINDRYVGKTEISKKHIIPVYGLYEGANNLVKLTLDDGTSNSVLIKTYSFEYAITDDVYVSDNNNVLYNLYNIENASYLRAFDYYTNLKFNVENLNYINSYMIKNDMLVVNYSSNKSVKGTYIEMDLLGHIVSISDSYEGFESMDNFEYDLYANSIYNYNLKIYNNNNENTSYSKLEFKDVADSLAASELYKGKFNAMVVDEKLYFNIDAVDSYLILVRDDGKVLSYAIEDVNNVITIDSNHEYSLYLLSGDTYYSLYTIV